MNRADPGGGCAAGGAESGRTGPQAPMTSGGGYPGAQTAALAAFIGGAFTAVSLYWALGGTGLLDTVGGSIQQDGRAGSAALSVLALASVVLKLAASMLPLVLVSPRTSQRWRRPVRVLCVLEAVILTGYGAVLSVVGWAVQAGLIKTARSADHRALAWHAFLWDPWFLAWGLTVLAAVILSRSKPRTDPPSPTGTAEVSGRP